MTRLSELWARLWFKPESTLCLDVIRIGLGLCLLFAYGGLTPHLVALYGDQGWVPRAAMELYLQSPLHHSLHYHLTGADQLRTVHAIMLLSCLLFTTGTLTPVAKWLVLFGHVSYAYRNPLITYGLDSILASALLLLCLAPIGSTLSVDRWLRRRLARRRGLEPPAPHRSPFNFTIRRLLQIQMAVVLLFSAIEKLRGEYWWSGEAVWVAVNNYEFTNLPVAWLAHTYGLVNLLTYGALGLELAYPFLIWQRATRPLLLGGAIALHAGIAAMMGLYLFSAAMIVGHLSFVRPAWYGALRTRWREQARGST